MVIVFIMDLQVWYCKMVSKLRDFFVFFKIVGLLYVQVQYSSAAQMVDQYIAHVADISPASQISFRQLSCHLLN